ncbi:hypothetical protein CRE_00274 [Caenorhabditis remanei]|uniref:Uncharacterized protein n=1 Tax=Caenorhabditis remanei TaxID=31234 RepID=E3LE91_CAERE|nr:hypothetical protein CRE_00274 [Caenorhabditis remanei]
MEKKGRLEARTTDDIGPSPTATPSLEWRALWWCKPSIWEGAPSVVVDNNKRAMEIRRRGRRAPARTRSSVKPKEVFLLPHWTLFLILGNCLMMTAGSLKCCARIDESCLS